MKNYSPHQTSMLQSDHFQRPNIWDDKITPFLLKYTLPIIGGIIGGLIADLIVKGQLK